jgi:hypothetical protein
MACANKYLVRGIPVESSALVHLFCITSHRFLLHRPLPARTACGAVGSQATVKSTAADADAMKTFYVEQRPDALLFLLKYNPDRNTRVQSLANRVIDSRHAYNSSQRSSCWIVFNCCNSRNQADGTGGRSSRPYAAVIKRDPAPAP